MATTVTGTQALELRMTQRSAAASNERRRGFVGVHGAELVRIHAQLDACIDMWKIIHLDLEVEPDVSVGTE